MWLPRQPIVSVCDFKMPYFGGGIDGIAVEESMGVQVMREVGLESICSNLTKLVVESSRLII